MVGGGLHEGGGSTIYSYIFERGWLKGNSVQRNGGGLHERVRYVLVQVTSNRYLEPVDPIMSHYVSKDTPPAQISPYYMDNRNPQKFFMSGE